MWANTTGPQRLSRSIDVTNKPPRTTHSRRVRTTASRRHRADGKQCRMDRFRFAKDPFHQEFQHQVLPWGAEIASAVVDFGRPTHGLRPGRHNRAMQLSRQ
jgi:hypothetical protein